MGVLLCMLCTVALWGPLTQSIGSRGMYGRTPNTRTKSYSLLAPDTRLGVVVCY